MYGTNINNGITLTKMLSGLSKTLGIVNQAIPIYKEIKPMVGNAKKIMSILKEFKSSNINQKYNSVKKIIDAPAKEKTDYHSNQSSPNFFL